MSHNNSIEASKNDDVTFVEQVLVDVPYVDINENFGKRFENLNASENIREQIGSLLFDPNPTSENLIYDVMNENLLETFHDAWKKMYS